MSCGQKKSEGGTTSDNEVISGSTFIPSSCIALPLKDELVAELSYDATDFALLNGAGMRYKDTFSVSTITNAPFFLLPSPFPRRDFEKVYNMQPLINKLMHKVAHDYEFLEKCLSNTIKVDEFTRKLWNIYTTVRKEGIRQPVSLGLLRSDVMLTECTPGCCKLCLLPPYFMNQQVELNTIAAGFGHLGPISAEIQKYVLRKMGRNDLVEKMPKNTALEELCKGLLAAYDNYNVKGSVILFMVEVVSYNICDQRFHEYEVMKQRPGVKVLRKKFIEVYENGRLDENGKLWIGEDEVAVVYFRTGYDPGCYKGPNEWSARLTIERSTAIKCPSVSYHLSGTKKVQQELASIDALKRFLSAEEAEKVSEIFTGLYTLDMGTEGDKTVTMATSDPEKYVLKPQREGGGHNIYGEEIKQTLEQIGSSAEREAFILMDRIRPPVQSNYLVRPNQPTELVSIVSELGIFGAILGSSEEILYNKSAGHMLRSKISTNNEGGVHSGYGALDSVLLVD